MILELRIANCMHAGAERESSIHNLISVGRVNVVRGSLGFMVEVVWGAALVPLTIGCIFNRTLFGKPAA